jgi:hypothetical protein
VLRPVAEYNLVRKYRTRTFFEELHVSHLVAQMTAKILWEGSFPFYRIALADPVTLFAFDMAQLLVGGRYLGGLTVPRG